MKTRFTFLLLLILVMIISPLTYPQTAQYGFKDNYYIGILGNGFGNVYPNFSGLNLNLWHHYCNHWDKNPSLHGIDNGWTELVGTDYLQALKDDYAPQIRQILSSNAGNNYRTIMDRVKINRLCYGQRSDYQCEASNIDAYYNFYSFGSHDAVDGDIQDFNYGGDGHWVRHCPLYNSTNQGLNPPHTVVWNLKANREQVNINGWSHPYEIDSLHNFIVKPRIRIPQSFVIPANYETPVCSVVVYNWNGPPNPNNIILDVTLKAKHFLVHNGGTNYTGDYIEEYNFSSEGYNLFLIDNLTEGPNKFNPDKHFILDNPCNVDIQVYWLGNCDMWIDYVRVDDDVADDLFGTGPKHDLYMDWLYWEAHEIAVASGDNPLKFYIEEFEFNNVPCIAYVNQKLMQYSGNKYKVACVLNIGEFYYVHRRDVWNTPPITADFVNATLVQRAGLDEIIAFAYPFYGKQQQNVSYVPSTLPRSWYEPSEGRLKSSYVILKVYNIQGKEIETLINQKRNTGSYTVTFDGTNYPSGVYFYRMTVDGEVVGTKKMILLK